MNSDDLKKRYNLQLHNDAFESTELKFVSLKEIKTFLISSGEFLTPAAVGLLTVCSRFYL